MAAAEGVASGTVGVAGAGVPEGEHGRDVARGLYVEIGFGRQSGAAVSLG